MTKHTANYVGFSSNPTGTGAKGIWDLFRQAFYIKLGSWPTAKLHINSRGVGIETSLGSYNFIQFNSPGFLNVDGITPQVVVDYWIISGGSNSGGGGGGGAGGVITGSVPGASIGIGSFAVTVGAVANNSTFAFVGGPYSTTRGGGGGSYGCGANGQPGGSGGGGRAYCGGDAGSNPGGAGISGQGNPGGNGQGYDPYGGGGGGGKGGAGSFGQPSGGTGGAGIGLTDFPTFVGTPGPDPVKRYIASGGGGRDQGSARGPVGNGFGANTGGGGSASSTGAGSGAVIIRYYLDI